MGHFFKSYKGLTFVLIQGVILLHYAFVTKIGPGLSTSFQGNPIALYLVNGVLEGSGIWVALVWLPSLVYEKFFWSVLNRRKNFSGIWHSHVTYMNLERPGPIQQRSGITTLPSGMEFDVIIQINQNVHGVVLQGDSESAEHFKTILAGINEDGNLTVVYSVSRSADPTGNWPEEILGVEHMQIRDSDFSGRPTELISQFWHCAKPSRPLYSGTAKMVRLGKKEIKDLRENMRLPRP